VLTLTTQGKIVEEGTHDQLLSQDGWYKKQFLLQQVEHNTEEVIS
jgi:ATP-binding cassette subfamily B protein